MPTHVLAEAAIHSGRFHAIKYRSERDPTGINLVVYCDLVSPPDRVVVRDPAGNLFGAVVFIKINVIPMPTAPSP